MQRRARPDRPPQRRVSRSGAARRVRRTATSHVPRMDQRNETFVPHVLAIVAGTTVDFPNSDHTYHNVFSLSKTKSFDLGRYAVGRFEAGPVRSPGHRPRVLRHPFAHERVHPRVRAPYLRGDRRRWPLPASRTCRRAPTPWWRGTKRRRSIAPDRRPGSGAKSSSTSRSAVDDALLVPHQSHLPGQRAARGAVRSASPSTASTSPSRRRPRASCTAASRRRARCVEEYRTDAVRALRPRRRGWSPTCRNSKRRSTRRIRRPFSRSRSEYQHAVGADLFLVTGPVRPRARQGGRLRSGRPSDARRAARSRGRRTGKRPSRSGRTPAASSRSLRCRAIDSAAGAVRHPQRRLQPRRAAAEQFKALTNSEIAFALDGRVQARRCRAQYRRRLARSSAATASRVDPHRRRANTSRSAARCRRRRRGDRRARPAASAVRSSSARAPSACAFLTRGPPRARAARRSSRCSLATLLSYASRAPSRGRSARSRRRCGRWRPPAT